MLVIQRPYLIGALGPQPLRGDRRVAEPLALALTLRHPEPLLAPQALYPLAVDLPALLPQPMVRAAVSPPRALLRELPQRSPQHGVIRRAHRLVTLRGAMLTNHPASPALADAETVAQHHDRLTPAGRAYQFPREISFNA
jgi:hypothetical protein